MEDPRRRKLLYRAMHRGFKEADIVIGTFAEEKLAGMSDAELDEFEHLLEVPDRELYEWIIKRQPTPANYAGPVMDMLQAFPLPAVLAKKV